MLKVIPMPRLRQQYKRRWRLLSLRRKVREEIPYILWGAVGFVIGCEAATYVMDRFFGL